MRSRLHRRRVLQIAGGGLAAWSLGRFLPGCSQATRPRGAGDLAVEGRSPHLVLLADPRYPEWRGLQWSAYFDLGTDSALADLASCELVFAIPAQVREKYPSIEIDESALPQALLIRPESGSCTLIPAPDYEPQWSAFIDSGHPEPLRDWIAQLETSIHEVLAASMIAPSADVHSAAESLRQRLSHAAPTGGKWARSSDGCGSLEFEDGTRFDAAYDCGMAVLPERSRRFLWLYCEESK